MEETQRNIWVSVAVVVIAVLVGVYFWRSQKKAAAPAGLEIPQVTIQNNPIEKKIPEINPAERANPFKYKNPLSK